MKHWSYARRAVMSAAVTIAFIVPVGVARQADASLVPSPASSGVTFDPFPGTVGIADTAAAHHPTRDEYLVATHSASGVRSIVVSIVSGDGTIVVAPFALHVSPGSGSGSVGSPVDTRLDVEYNPSADEYLVSFVMSAPRPGIAGSTPRVVAQRVGPTGTLIGGITPISAVSSSDFRCTANHHDVTVDAATGDYVLAYAVGMFFATLDPCEDLSGQHKTTVARVSPTLAVGPRIDLPGRFANGNDSFTSIAPHPTTGDFMIGRLDSDGGRFTLVGPGLTVKADESIDVALPDVGNFPAYVAVAADAMSGKWLAIARGTQGTKTMVLDADGSVDTPAAVRFEGSVDRLEGIGNGIFVGPGSGKVRQLDLSGNVVSELVLPADGGGSEPGEVTPAGDGRFLAVARVLVGFVPAAAIELVGVQPATLPLSPSRIADTRRASSAQTVDGDFLGGGPIDGGRDLELVVAGRAGVPDDATAAMLNIAAAGATTGGYITAYPCGSERPTTSNLNFSAGAPASAGAYVALSDAGTTCLFASTTTEMIIDVTGYVPGTASITSIVPERLLETRPGQANGTVDGDEEGEGRLGSGVIELPVAGRGSVDAEASAVMINITAVRPDSQLFVTAFPCGQPQPTAANLNVAAGGSTNNLAFARIGIDGKVCLFTSGPTDLIVDVSAFVPAVGSLVSINPERFVETRVGEETIDGRDQFGRRLGAEQSFNFLAVAGRSGVPSEAKGVMLNVAAIKPLTAGFITVYPCGDRPNTASVNYAAGSVTSNAVFVALSDPDGWICVFTSAETDLAIDVVGYTTDG
ncbi:hypothetical protein [Ilumatobacter coccineus]|uniref:Uncharacterized protein n=1 Tax=Ilumatobacter coccineus (strain NBRC 103263 / KCTC 29153 / YM16-304) TaxID=1313172 RepID=A0A6C7E995_ILUCY|nr:hypothetical protein [Ilumatobacter coccineus]BAN03031.1 hypothetical protein YM304_27170 [Ilumatobacter coccineus YM16-304]